MAGIDRVEVDNMSVQFFEGVEKLLEIWFTTSDSSNKNPDLRKIPRFVFIYIYLDKVNKSTIPARSPCKFVH